MVEALSFLFADFHALNAAEGPYEIALDSVFCCCSECRRLVCTSVYTTHEGASIRRLGRAPRPTSLDRAHSQRPCCSFTSLRLHLKAFQTAPTTTVMSDRRASSSSYLSSSNVGGSHAFLNAMNPLGGKRYQGYMRADESLREEDEENVDEDDIDLEAGRPHRSIQLSESRRAQGKKPRVLWAGEDGADMASLRPNIHQEDKNHEPDSDDDVPQSFMIEATSPKRQTPTPAAAKGKSRQSTPLARAAVPAPSLPAPVSIPPRPSEVDVEETPRSSGQQPKQMRGLDAYERALWNWVNVYNLDAFLQEVYYYYQGKGIWCIALSRGLNLLYVVFTLAPSLNSRALSTVGFVISFSTFLLGCVDYSRIRPEGITRLSDVVVPHCVSRCAPPTTRVPSLIAS